MLEFFKYSGKDNDAEMKYMKRNNTTINNLLINNGNSGKMK